MVPRQSEGRILRDAWDTQGEIVRFSVRVSQRNVGTNSRLLGQGEGWCHFFFPCPSAQTDFSKQHGTRTGDLRHLQQALAPCPLQVLLYQDKCA